MGVEFASVSEVERERAIGTLVLAFTADPFVRWIYPEASQYLSRFPEALQAFGGVAFGQGGVWRLGDFAAVALWLPPGVEPGGDATVALFQATVDSRSSMTCWGYSVKWRRPTRQCPTGICRGSASTAHYRDKAWDPSS